MNFKEWLDLQEIADVLQKSTQEINLRRNSYSEYTCEFLQRSKTITPIRYEVVFARKSYFEYEHDIVRPISISNIWEITLKGPKGYSTTGYMQGATAVYSNLLLAIRKLMEIETVNGFKFNPVEDAMELIYHKLFTKFAANGFVRVSDEYYIKKDVLEQELQQSSKEIKVNFYQNIDQKNRRWDLEQTSTQDIVFGKEKDEFDKWEAESNCRRTAIQQNVPTDQERNFISQCTQQKEKEWQDLEASSYRYRFNHDSGLYEVYFGLLNGHKLFETNIDYAWDITFRGPNSYRLTNKGGSQNAIYSKVLLACKKFLEIAPVNMVLFKGFQPEMDLVYHKFYKRFMSDFVQVTKDGYIKREVLQEILKNKPNKQKDYQSILYNYRNKLNNLKAIKDAKNRMRQLKAQYQIGEIIGIEYSLAGFIKKISETKLDSDNGQYYPEIEMKAVYFHNYIPYTTIASSNTVIPKNKLNPGAEAGLLSQLKESLRQGNTDEFLVWLGKKYNLAQ